MNILFAASEAQPYIASGGLADVIGSLPKAINRKGNDCRVVIPFYRAISQKFKNKLTFLFGYNIITIDIYALKYLRIKQPTETKSGECYEFRI